MKFDPTAARLHHVKPTTHVIVICPWYTWNHHHCHTLKTTLYGIKNHLLFKKKLRSLSKKQKEIVPLGFEPRTFPALSVTDRWM